MKKLPARTTLPAFSLQSQPKWVIGTSSMNGLPLHSLEDFSNRKYRLSKEFSHSIRFLFDSVKVYITSRGEWRFHLKRKLTRDSILKNTDTLLKRKCFENSFVELCKLNRILRFSFKVALLKISLREGGALNERLRIRPFAKLWRWNSSRAFNINHFGVNGTDFAPARYSRNWEVKE